MANPKYKKWLTPEGLVQIQGWARCGLSDAQIAHNMNINVSTLYKWENAHSEIVEALRKGKEVVDYEIENSLYKICMGYRTKTTKTTYDKEGNVSGSIVTEKYIPPNIIAIKFWLVNRKPDEWRNDPAPDANSRALEMLDHLLDEFQEACKD